MIISHLAFLCWSKNSHRKWRSKLKQMKRKSRRQTEAQERDALTKPTAYNEGLLVFLSKTFFVTVRCGNVGFLYVSTIHCSVQLSCSIACSCGTEDVNLVFLSPSSQYPLCLMLFGENDTVSNLLFSSTFLSSQFGL